MRRLPKSVQIASIAFAMCLWAVGWIWVMRQKEFVDARMARQIDEGTRNLRDLWIPLPIIYLGVRFLVAEIRRERVTIRDALTVICVGILMSPAILALFGWFLPRVR